MKRWFFRPISDKTVIFQTYVRPKFCKMKGAYVKLYCKKKKIRPDGTAPIYFALRLDKEKLLYTGKSIDPDLFDNSGGGEIINKMLYSKLNTFLEVEKNKLNTVILEVAMKIMLILAPDYFLLLDLFWISIL